MEGDLFLVDVSFWVCLMDVVCNSMEVDLFLVGVSFWACLVGVVCGEGSGEAVMGVETVEADS